MRFHIFFMMRPKVSGDIFVSDLINSLSLLFTDHETIHGYHLDFWNKPVYTSHLRLSETKGLLDYTMEKCKSASILAEGSLILLYAGTLERPTMGDAVKVIQEAMNDTSSILRERPSRDSSEDSVTQAPAWLEQFVEVLKDKNIIQTEVDVHEAWINVLRILADSFAGQPKRCIFHMHAQREVQAGILDLSDSERNSLTRG